MSALLNAATIDNPTDATYLIKDHDLGRNNRDYSAWKNSGATAPKSSAGNAASTVYSVEAYHVAFDVCQELTGVPNGVYGVQVNGFYRQDGSNTDLPYVYANDSQKTLPVRTGTENNMQDAAVSFVAGNYLSDLAYVQVTDGNLKVGVSTKGNSCWAIFKSLHLKYYGDVNLTQVVLKDKIAAFEKALADAKPVASSTDQMTQSFRDALNAAITKYDGKSYDTEEEYDAAINELTTATDKARKNIESYKNAPAYFAKMKAVLDNTNVYTQESYDDYYGTWLAQYEEGTLTEELSESKAYSSGWHSANYIDDILLSTWTIGDKQCKDYTAGMYINTWSVEGNTDGSEFFAPFFEYWVADAQSVAANTMISKVTNLKPNTNYSFTIRARVRQTNGKTKPAEAIMLQVGEGTPVDMLLSNYVYEKLSTNHQRRMVYHYMFPADQITGWDGMKRVIKGFTILMHSVTYRTEMLRECGLHLPKHTFYVDNLFVFEPLPYVKTIYYLDVDFYRYYIGRDGQSVAEQTMVKRIDQQLYVNYRMIDNFDPWSIEEDNLRNYMLSYLETITVVSSVIGYVSNTPEDLAKVKKLWRHMREKDVKMYRHVRFGVLGNAMNLPGRFGRYLSLKSYHIAQRFIGFN